MRFNQVENTIERRLLGQNVQPNEFFIWFNLSLLYIHRNQTKVYKFTWPMKMSRKASYYLLNRCFLTAKKTQEFVTLFLTHKLLFSLARMISFGGASNIIPFLRTFNFLQRDRALVALDPSLINFLQQLRSFCQVLRANGAVKIACWSLWMKDINCNISTICYIDYWASLTLVL